MSAWKLYWVTDDNGDEDCFIIARTARSARRYHEESEGLNPGDARAELIARVPEHCEAAAIERLRAWSRKQAPQQADKPNLHPWPGWARREELLALGAQLLNHDGTREVVIGGRSFFPVTLEELVDSRRRASLQ
jgi:hypothetical protein